MTQASTNSSSFHIFILGPAWCVTLDEPRFHTNFPLFRLTYKTRLQNDVISPFAPVRHTKAMGHTQWLHESLLERQHFNEHYKIVFENRPHFPPYQVFFSSVHFGRNKANSSLLTQQFISINNYHVMYKYYWTLGWCYSEVCALYVC